jgi:hypothetical protein
MDWLNRLAADFYDEVIVNVLRRESQWRLRREVNML